MLDGWRLSEEREPTEKEVHNPLLLDVQREPPSGYT